jgi:hypothetical protein
MDVGKDAREKNLTRNYINIIIYLMIPPPPPPFCLANATLQIAFKWIA